MKQPMSAGHWEQQHHQRQQDPRHVPHQGDSDGGGGAEGYGVAEGGKVLAALISKGEGRRRKKITMGDLYNQYVYCI